MIDQPFLPPLSAPTPAFTVDWVPPSAKRSLCAADLNSDYRRSDETLPPPDLQSIPPCFIHVDSSMWSYRGASNGGRWHPPGEHQRPLAPSAAMQTARRLQLAVTLIRCAIAATCIS